MEDDTALDDKASLRMIATDQEGVPPTGVNVAEELERVNLDKKAAQAKCNLAAGQYFTFYANLLSKDARYQLDKIVALQVDTAP